MSNRINESDALHLITKGFNRTQGAPSLTAQFRANSPNRLIKLPWIGPKPSRGFSPSLLYQPPQRLLMNTAPETLTQKFKDTSVDRKPCHLNVDRNIELLEVADLEQTVLPHRPQIEVRELVTPQIGEDIDPSFDLINSARFSRDIPRVAIIPVEQYLGYLTSGLSPGLRISTADPFNKSPKLRITHTENLRRVETIWAILILLPRPPPELDGIRHVIHRDDIGQIEGVLLASMNQVGWQDVLRHLIVLEEALLVVELI